MALCEAKLFFLCLYDITGMVKLPVRYLSFYQSMVRHKWVSINVGFIRGGSFTKSFVDNPRSDAE